MNRWLGPIIFFGLGLALLIGGLAIYASQRAYVARTRTTMGTVVDVGDHRSAKGEPESVGFVQWKDPNGDTRELKTYRKGRLAFAKGETVIVRYDPAALEDAATDTAGGTPFAVFILGIIGAVFCGIAIKVAVRTSRVQRSPS